MTQIVCFANSRKHSGRCVAGVNPATGEWIRPVSRLDDGRVAVDLCIVDGEPIRLLDVIDIPISEQGQGYECENRLILSRAWRRSGKVKAKEIAQYCERDILYGDRQEWLGAVPHAYLLSLPASERRTIQLVETENFRAWRHYDTWKGAIPLATGEELVANITDLELCRRLEAGCELSDRCLIVLSLSQPWKKPDSEAELKCYRLIAGVIELKDEG